MRPVAMICPDCGTPMRELGIGLGRYSWWLCVVPTHLGKTCGTSVAAELAAR